MKLTTLKGILFAIAAVVLISVGIIFAMRFEKSHEAVPEGAGSRTASETTAQEGEFPSTVAQEYGAVETIQYEGQQYVYNKDISTLLLIGVDDEEMIEVDRTRNDALADFLVLAVLNNADKTCTLLQINRNTMTDVATIGLAQEAFGSTYEQIALSHTYGNGLEESCEYTAGAVSWLLFGVPINNYLSMAMGGINILNEKVGGVTVAIEDDLTSVDAAFVKGSTVTLQGDQAEKFVRARYGLEDDSNPARQMRQRSFIEGLVSKLRTDVEADPGFAIDLYASLDEYLVTDCDINELGTYSENLSEYTLSGFVTPEGETRLREQTEFAEFYVDEDALQKLVVDMFYVPYTPEQTPAPAPAEEPQPAVSP